MTKKDEAKEERRDEIQRVAERAAADVREREAKDEGRLIADAGAKQKELQHATTVRDLTARIKELEGQLAAVQTEHRKVVVRNFDLEKASSGAATPSKDRIRAVEAAIHRYHALGAGCADGNCAKAVLEVAMLPEPPG